MRKLRTLNGRLFCLLALGALAGFNLTVLSIAWLNSDLRSPPATPILEDRNGNFLSEDKREGEPLGFWDVEGEINPKLKQCLLAVEDRRFYDHAGVDSVALVRALANNAGGGDRQGASTIAMQVARLQGSGGRTLVVKLCEALTAYFLVMRHGHEAVLRQYLKLMPQGNQIFGAVYAARRYFGKPLADLGLAESALLAALPNAPGRMNPFTWQGMDRARTRARLILDLLKRQKSISDEQYVEAARQVSDWVPLEREERPHHSFHYILRVLDEQREIGQRYQRPLRSSLDLGVQDLLNRVADRAMGEHRKNLAGNIAIIVADRASGEVLGYVGSRAYFDREHAGGINYARTPRSSGSTLKPFLFAQGLDHGFTPGSVLADLPFALLNISGEYRVLNFDDDYLGPLIFRRALANSRNVPALRVLEKVGLYEFYDKLRQLRLMRDNRHGPEYYGYGLAIGGVYVTLEDLVAAYGSLANEGRAYRLRWLAAAVGEQRQPWRQDPPFSGYAAQTLGLFLSDDAARFPSFPRRTVLEYNFPVAIKTGTSQGFRDAWSVAWTSRYVVGVWIGNADNSSMNHVAGLSSAAYLREVLTALQPLQAQGIDTEPFQPPPGTIAIPVCVLSGQIAGPDCPSRQTEYFRPSQVPRGECEVHTRYAIDRLTGRLADRNTPPHRVLLKMFTVLPPEYAYWGSKNGYGEAPISNQSVAVDAVNLKITYPISGNRFLVDPDQPPRLQTLPLQAVVRPRVPQISWEIDGKLFETQPYPYAARWPLSPGSHRIRALVPGSQASSPEVLITVE